MRYWVINDGRGLAVSENDVQKRPKTILATEFFLLGRTSALQGLPRRLEIVNPGYKGYKRQLKLRYLGNFLFCTGLADAWQERFGRT